MGIFSVDLMAQGAIGSPVYVDVKKGHVVVHLHGELYFPVTAILFSVRPEDKSFINTTEPPQNLSLGSCTD